MLTTMVSPIKGSSGQLTPLQSHKYFKQWFWRFEAQTLRQAFNVYICIFYWRKVKQKALRAPRECHWECHQRSPKNKMRIFENLASDMPQDVFQSCLLLLENDSNFTLQRPNNRPVKDIRSLTQG